MTQPPDWIATIITRTIDQIEGDYVNDPDDPGGETKYGITKRTYPDLDIKNLTKEEAILIYWRDWWPWLDGIRSHALCAKLFEVAINTGQSRAKRLLQLAVNAYNGNQALVVDGVVGPKTIAMTNLCVPDLLRRFISAAQAGYYVGLVAGNPDLKKFYNGWQRRALS